MTGDGTWTYTWEHGRKLATMSSGGTTWTFTYDADGMRTQRASSSATYNYVYNGRQLSQMTVGSNTLSFAYEASGTPLSVTYNGTTYYYATNLQGDITAILNTSGTAVVTYTYDAWGHILSTSGSMASTLGTHNPLRYRGYVYDTETGLYYLQSRYYKPEVGRWISPEPNVCTGTFDLAAGIVGYNTYAYCANNPVIYKDVTGEGVVLTCILVFAGIGALIGACYGADVSYSQTGSVDGRMVLSGALIGAGIGGVVGWGVGAAASAIGIGATTKIVGSLTPGLYQSWQQAEQALRVMFNGITKYMYTEYGARVVDSYSNGVAREAKYGFTKLTQFILRQIEKDIWLLNNGKVESVEWHFYWSFQSNSGGASQALIDALLNAGIKVFFH